MRGLNSIALCGAINQPEMVKFSEGDKPRGEIVQFSLATARAWRDKDDKWVEVTEWHEIRVFNPRLIEKSISAQLQKGAIVSVSGRLQYETWEDNGKTRKKAVIACEKLEIIVKSSRVSTGATADIHPDAPSEPRVNIEAEPAPKIDA